MNTHLPFREKVSSGGFFMTELAKMIALDEISLWRPGWDMRAWKMLYYGGFANWEVLTSQR